ncbi:metallophosphoesterase [candidate division CSSED10-310 bacterium]|uniref:Metallophosphoesterase n=1 Tax=candidate division CSSED10-310 bacterium TaxID=2855610 RepID=A0ABV6Z159_UNCC1
MGRIIFFIIFLLTVSSIYFGMHYYIYKRIVANLLLSEQLARYLQLLFFIGGLSFISGEILSRRFSFSWLLMGGVFWMGIMAISFAVFLVRDILALMIPFSPRISTITALVVVSVMVAYSLFNAHQPPHLKKVEVKIKNLPASFQGTVIIQLSDLHLNGIKSEQWLQGIVERVNKCQPDIIVVTGDLIDRDLEKIKLYIPILQQLKAKSGIFSIPGNHEYYAGIENYLSCIRACGMVDVSNKVMLIKEKLQLAGLPDVTGKQYGYFQPALNKTLAACDPEKPLILITHAPLQFQEAVEGGVDFQISGHTHAGQIPPMDLIVRLIYKYPYGLSFYNSASIYTTCGTGTWGPPMRFSSRSEIVHFTLSPS